MATITPHPTPDTRHPNLTVNLIFVQVLIPPTAASRKQTKEYKLRYL
ncbi:hypothetical protein [Gloeothece verrucosa]|nr:hypothetical protein [Gloeothece verrucosa]